MTLKELEDLIAEAKKQGATSQTEITVEGLKDPEDDCYIGVDYEPASDTINISHLDIR